VRCCLEEDVATEALRVGVSYSDTGNRWASPATCQWVLFRSRADKKWNSAFTSAAFVG